MELVATTFITHCDQSLCPTTKPSFCSVLYSSASLKSFWNVRWGRNGSCAFLPPFCCVAFHCARWKCACHIRNCSVRIHRNGLRTSWKLYFFTIRQCITSKFDFESFFSLVRTRNLDHFWLLFAFQILTRSRKFGHIYRRLFLYL